MRFRNFQFSGQTLCGRNRLVPRIRSALKIIATAVPLGLCCSRAIRGHHVFFKISFRPYASE